MIWHFAFIKLFPDASATSSLNAIILMSHGSIQLTSYAVAQIVSTKLRGVRSWLRVLLILIIKFIQQNALKGERQTSLRMLAVRSTHLMQVFVASQRSADLI